MDSKVLLVLVALCCWCLASQQVRGSRLDDLRHQLRLDRALDREAMAAEADEEASQRKRRPLSSLSRKPEVQDYHFASGIFRKRMIGDGRRALADPGYYAFEDE